MPTVPTHALVATTLFVLLGRRQRAAMLWTLGAVCAMLPDLDVVGFAAGVRYGDLLGHRGLSHSLPFAALVASLAVCSARLRGRRFAAWWFLFACTASHGVLDAATDGGLGVAFFSPFSNTRYFWPWRPIRVAPIGLTRIFSARGRDVFETELLWIWLPCALVIVAAYFGARKKRGRQPGRPRATAR
jgi:inner membrane protein